MKTIFHLRARALIVLDNQILIARMKGKETTFLPGGHIELGEGAMTTLKREIQEEMGKKCKVKKYLGAVEHGWISDNEQHFEMNHIFHVNLIDITSAIPIESREQEFEFFWAKINDFEQYNLHPIPLRSLIKEWLEGDASPWWGSTLK